MPEDSSSSLSSLLVLLGLSSDVDVAAVVDLGIPLARASAKASTNSDFSTKEAVDILYSASSALSSDIFIDFKASSSTATFASSTAKLSSDLGPSIPSKGGGSSESSARAAFFGLSFAAAAVVEFGPLRVGGTRGSSFSSSSSLSLSSSPSLSSSSSFFLPPPVCMTSNSSSPDAPAPAVQHLRHEEIMVKPICTQSGTDTIHQL
mmetsp:Transcript_6566/g.12774  ORF Transcript_6566/g.12774 Transcript_6566/m.12774 type:complete len:205 (-) Transcript_6566:1464-2078(-)